MNVFQKVGSKIKAVATDPLTVFAIKASLLYVAAYAITVVGVMTVNTAIGKVAGINLNPGPASTVEGVVVEETPADVEVTM